MYLETRQLILLIQYMLYIQYFTFLESQHDIAYLSPIKYLISVYWVNSNIQVFRKSICYMGSNENKTFSSYYIQKKPPNIVFE